MRLIFKAVVGIVALAASDTLAADCTSHSQIYRAQRSLQSADAYIACLETNAALVASGNPVVGTGPVPGSPIFGPVVGPIGPGGPSFMPVEEMLRKLKENGGYSDYSWSQMMAATLSADGSMAVIYDKARVLPTLRDKESFAVEVDARGRKFKQLFVDASTFGELTEFVVEGGQ